MRGGFNKKPEGLKLVIGTDRKDRTYGSPISSSQPQHVFQKTPPSWLPKFAAAFWRKYAPPMEQAGLLTEVDQPQFEMLCLLYDRIVRAEEILLREGLLVDSAREDGAKIKNPVHTILAASHNQFRLLCQEFGLSPASRARLDLVQGELFEDPMEKLYEG